MSQITPVMFAMCSSLIWVIIPSSVTSIAPMAFYACPVLSQIFYIGTETQWNDVTIDNVSLPQLENTTIYYYSETEQAGGWHYVEGVPTLW